jgi:uncharacterized membrane protein YozB (DUF420 family)
MLNFLNAPGFLGTRALMRSDLTLVLTLLSAALFTLGWQLAIRKRFEAHRWVQTAAATLNALIVLIFMVTSFVANILPGIPAKLAEGSYGITTLHGLLGVAALAVGVFVTLRANGLMPKPLRFRNYKLFMRVAYSLYMLSTLGGVALYVVVFVYGI